jgi:hypothetical protein
VLDMGSRPIAIMSLGPWLPRRSAGGEGVHPALTPNLVLLACTAVTSVRMPEHLEFSGRGATCEPLIRACFDTGRPSTNDERKLSTRATGRPAGDGYPALTTLIIALGVDSLVA